jgi:hypothetical protein
MLDFFGGFIMTLMPCFVHKDEAYEEGIIVGRLLASYGEIEMAMCACIIEQTPSFDFASPVRQLFTERGEQKRIRNARTALIAPYQAVNLQKEITKALNDMEWCRRIRNQYAHCQWYWTSHEGLCFVDLEAVAKLSIPITELTKNKLSVTLVLLQAQWEFFEYVFNTFDYLRWEYRKRRNKLLGSTRADPVLVEPTKRKRPRLHD